MVDIGDVETVAGLLMPAGYKAETRKSKNGESYIAGGADFSIAFYGCKKDTVRDSFEITSWYKKAPYFSPTLINRVGMDAIPRRIRALPVGRTFKHKA